MAEQGRPSISHAKRKRARHQNSRAFGHVPPTPDPDPDPNPDPNQIQAHVVPSPLWRWTSRRAASESKLQKNDHHFWVCGAQGGGWGEGAPCSVRGALCALLCARCSARGALCALLCAPCSVRAALCALLCAWCSVRGALCAVLCAPCSARAWVHRTAARLHRGIVMSCHICRAMT